MVKFVLVCFWQARLEAGHGARRPAAARTPRNDTTLLEASWFAVSVCQSFASRFYIYVTSHLSLTIGDSCTLLLSLGLSQDPSRSAKHAVRATPSPTAPKKKAHHRENIRKREMKLPSTSCGTDMPSLRPLAGGRQRTRSDVESVAAATEAARLARKAVRDEAEREAEREAAEIEATALRLHRQHLESVPFRFLDLPTELQEMVYSNFIASLPSSHGEIPTLELCAFAIPALAQVNQTVRTDFLQVFFKQVTFYIRIGHCATPPVYRLQSLWSHFGSTGLYKAIAAAKDPFDPVLLSPCASKLIGPATIFQNVTFALHQLHRPEDLQLALWKDRYCHEPQSLVSARLARLTLTWSNRRLEIGPPTADDMQPVPWRHKGFLKRSISLSEGIASRKEFSGFTVDDLRRIAIHMITGYGETKRRA